MIMIPRVTMPTSSSALPLPGTGAVIPAGSQLSLSTPAPVPGRVAWSASPYFRSDYLAMGPMPPSDRISSSAPPASGASGAGDGNGGSPKGKFPVTGDPVLDGVLQTFAKAERDLSRIGRALGRPLKELRAVLAVAEQFEARVGALGDGRLLQQARQGVDASLATARQALAAAAGEHGDSLKSLYGQAEALASFYRGLVGERPRGAKKEGVEYIAQILKRAEELLVAVEADGPAKKPAKTAAPKRSTPPPSAEASSPRPVQEERVDEGGEKHGLANEPIPKLNRKVAALSAGERTIQEVVDWLAAHDRHPFAVLLAVQANKLGADELESWKKKTTLSQDLLWFALATHLPRQRRIANLELAEKMGAKIAASRAALMEMAKPFIQGEMSAELAMEILNIALGQACFADADPIRARTRIARAIFEHGIFFERHFGVRQRELVAELVQLFPEDGAERKKRVYEVVAAVGLEGMNRYYFAAAGESDEWRLLLWSLASLAPSILRMAQDNPEFLFPGKDKDDDSRRDRLRRFAQARINLKLKVMAALEIMEPLADRAVLSRFVDLHISQLIDLSATAHISRESLVDRALEDDDHFVNRILKGYRAQKGS